MPVAAKGLLHHEPRVLGAAGFGELRGDLREQHRRDGEVVQGALGVAHFFPQLREHLGVGVIAIHIVKQAQELLERIGVDVPAMGFNAVRRATLKLVEIPALLGHSDNGGRQALVANEAIERWKDLLIGKIARGAEEDERVGNLLGRTRHYAFFSR